MADALISPAVGGTMWAASAGLIAWCAKRIRQTFDDKMIPMMGVLGAFIFAAQMINFSIPVTGSSGHIGGGMLLAILLGPYASFVVIASVLTVQALFFADGGLLALGCNIFNLGFFPSFIAYPLIFKPIAGEAKNGTRFWLGAMLAAILGLQLGAFGVVMETTMSGISDLPFKAFVLIMQPIHLAIGAVEGFATAAVAVFVLGARPVSMPAPADTGGSTGHPSKALIGLLVAAAIVGGVLSWFASSHPDGLEWSMGKVSGKEELESPAGGVHESLAGIQEKTAFLPDYGFKDAESDATIKAGTSISGIVGGLITLLVAVLIGFGIRKRRPTTGHGPQTEKSAG